MRVGNDQEPRDRAFQLHDQIQRMLDWLPVTAAVRVVRTALSRAAEQAYAKSDVPALDRIAKEAAVLARSLERHHVEDKTRPESADVKPRRRWRAPAPDATGVIHIHQHPGPPRREHAPLKYPWGDDPPVSPPRRSETLPSTPESQLPQSSQAWLRAMRSYWASRNAEESDAVRMYGVVHYHGADEPPTYEWPADPE